MPPVAAALPGILLNLAIGAAVNVGVGLISSAIAGSADATRNGGVALDPRAGIDVPVTAIFGEYVTPGTFWYQNSYGSDNEYLQLVYECGRGEHEALTGLICDGKLDTLSGSNADPKGRVVDSKTVSGTPHLWIKYYTGAAGQAADAELVAHANPTGRWPASKTMTGTAYVVITARFDEKVFESGLPSFRFVWKGLKCYDRRKDSTMPGGSGAHRWGTPSTYEWTANPAILQDNFRRGIWINGVRVLGLGVSEAACHHAKIVSAANLCDESVTYDDTGRTLKRYSFGGEIGDDADVLSVMKMFETAMAGYGTELGGAYAPLPAQTMTPVLTLTDRDRIPGTDVSEKKQLDPTEVKNAYNGIFMSPVDAWLTREYGLRKDAAVEAIEGGRRQGKLDLEFVPYQETAGAIAEIMRRRDRFSASEVATYSAKAAKLEPGDVITRVSALFGTIQMMVWGIKELPGAKFTLTLRAWSNTIVPDTDEGFLPIPATPVAAPVPSRPITVSAFLAVAATQVSGPNTVPAIRVTWTPITDRTVDRVIIKYWRDGEPDDARYLSVDQPASGLAVIEGVVPEADYVLTATIATTPARTTIWCTDQTVTTGALTVATVPGSGSVDYGALHADVKAALAWISRSARELRDVVQSTGRLVAEQDLGNYSTFDQLKRSVKVQLDSLTASFDEVIEVAIGPGGSIATALSSLYAAMGGNSSEVNVRFEAVAAPSGYSARYAIQAAVNDGTFRAATFYLDVPSDPMAPTRIVAAADQFIITDGVADHAPFIFEDGVAKLALSRAGKITSYDGVSMVTDYDNVEFYMER